MKYVVPPEHHMFERDSKYLILDPVNFIWFVTDDKGKAMFDGLAQTQEVEGAIQSLAHLVGMNPDDPSIAVYVSKFVAHLVEIGILHEGEYKRQEIGTGILDSPKILYIHLTSKCNLKCPYCYNQEHRAELIQIGRSPDSASLSTEGHTDDFLKIVDEAADLGFYQVKLTGGEALLNKDFLRIAKRAKMRGMNVNLLTNGSLMTKELAKEIVTCVDSVSISIDSDNPAEHDAVRGRGGHAKAIQAIQMLRDAGPIFIHVNAVMTPVNLESTASFLEYATNVLKAEKITIAGTGIKVEDPSQRWGAADYQLTKPQQERLYQLSSEFYKRQTSAQPISRWSLFRKQCGVGNGIVSLDPNGEIYPCQTLHRKEFECGNAFKLGLGTVLKESAVIKGTKMAAVDILPECKTCPVRYVCAGGCRSEAYTQEGDFLARNRMMCSSYFKGAVDQLWRAASIPVQDKERVFQSFETASYCAD
jgi:radical SAM protein with 4Fe4S-binding SPASM domain